MSLRAHLLHGCEDRSLCLIDVVALGPFGQPLFKLVAENEGVFTALTGPVFEGVVEAYIRDAAYKELDRDTVEMLKEPWVRRGEEGIREADGAGEQSQYGGRGGPCIIWWGKRCRWGSFGGKKTSGF